MGALAEPCSFQLSYRRTEIFSRILKKNKPPSFENLDG